MYPMTSPLRATAAVMWNCVPRRYNSDPRRPAVAPAGNARIIAAVTRNGDVMGYIDILVLFEVVYPEWPAYLLITLAAILAAVLSANWLAARLQRHTPRPSVNLAQTMQRVSLEQDSACESSEIPKMRWARSSTASIKCRAAPSSRLAPGEVSPIATSSRSRSARSILATPILELKLAIARPIAPRRRPSAPAAPRAISWRA